MAKRLVVVGKFEAEEMKATKKKSRKSKKSFIAESLFEFS